MYCLAGWLTGLMAVCRSFWPVIKVQFSSRMAGKAPCLCLAVCACVCFIFFYISRKTVKRAVSLPVLSSQLTGIKLAEQSFPKLSNFVVECSSTRWQWLWMNGCSWMCAHIWQSSTLDSIVCVFGGWISLTVSLCVSVRLLDVVLTLATCNVQLKAHTLPKHGVLCAGHRHKDDKIWTETLAAERDWQRPAAHGGGGGCGGWQGGILFSE